MQIQLQTRNKIMKQLYFVKQLTRYMNVKLKQDMLYTHI